MRDGRHALESAERCIYECGAASDRSYWGVDMKQFRAFALAALAVFATTGPLRAQSADQGSTSTFPLAPYERLVAFSNGCNIVLMPDEDGSYYSESRWYGGCRAGLADGVGYTIYDGQYSDGKYNRLKMHLGRAIAYDIAPTMPQNSVTISRGPGRNSSEMVSVDERPVRQPWEKAGESVLDRNGKTATSIVAQYRSADDQQQHFDRVYVIKASCPIPYIGSMEKSLASDYNSKKLDATARARLVPVCTKAVSRAESEGILNNSSSISSIYSFERVDYGYFFLVYSEQTVTQRKGNQTGYFDGNYTATISAAALCPAVTTLSGCEPVWRAMQAPFIAKRDALQAITKQVAATDAADREHRAAAWQERLAQYVAKLAAEAPDYAKPPSPQIDLPAVGRKKP
jgi:hypothetical protein